MASRGIQAASCPISCSLDEGEQRWHLLGEQHKLHDVGKLEHRVGHGREGVSNFIPEGRWERSCVSPGTALIHDEEEDTLKKHRGKTGELGGS